MTSFQKCQLLAAVNAFRTSSVLSELATMLRRISTDMIDADVIIIVNTNMFFEQSPSNLLQPSQSC